MEYTKEELKFLRKNNFETGEKCLQGFKYFEVFKKYNPCFRPNKYYNEYFFNTGLVVLGDHADDLAFIFYEKNKLTYSASLLDLFVDEMVPWWMLKDEESKIMKEELTQDICLWLNKINNISGASFKMKCLFPTVKFYQEIDVNNVDFPALREKIKKFITLMDKSLKELLQKVRETCSWDFRFSEAIIKDD